MGRGPVRMCSLFKGACVCAICACRPCLRLLLRGEGAFLLQARRAFLQNSKRTLFLRARRRDSIDATHYPVFHQMEGVQVFTPADWEAAGLDGTAFAERELKRALEGMAKHLFGAQLFSIFVCEGVGVWRGGGGVFVWWWCGEHGKCARMCAAWGVATRM